MRLRRFMLCRALVLVTTPVALATSALGCRDVTRFSSHGDHFEGAVVKGSFVRAGLPDDARMCLTLDAEHLQDGPGTISTSDGRFKSTTLRPIPQIWHDPLSRLSFGDGRVQNLLYVATPVAPASDTQDIMVVLSLMQEGGVEIRLVRGAPSAEDASAPVTDAGPAVPPPVIPPAVIPPAPPMFGVFTLDRRSGACSF